MDFEVDQGEVNDGRRRAEEDDTEHVDKAAKPSLSGVLYVREK